MVLWPAYAACALVSARYPRLLCPVLRLFRRRFSRRPPSPSPPTPELLLPPTLDPHTSLCLGRALQLLASSTTSDEHLFAQSEIARIITAGGGAVPSTGLTPAGVDALEAAALRRSAGGWAQAGVLLRALGGVGWVGALATVIPAALSLRSYLRPLFAILTSGKQWFLAYYAVLHLPAAASVIVEETDIRGGAVTLEALGCAAAWSLMVFEEKSVMLEQGMKKGKWDEDKFQNSVFVDTLFDWPEGAQSMPRWQRKLRSIARVRLEMPG